MDSYFYSWFMNIPTSPPLPDEYSGGYLPQMPPYSDASQSQNTSVPQPIDFGGSASGYNGASQSQHTSVPPIDYGSSSQSGGAIGDSASQSGGAIGSSASQRTIRQQYPEEVKSKALSEMQQEVARGGTLKSYADRSPIPYDTLKNWHRSITTRGHQTYSDEVKSKVLSEIEEEMASGGSLKTYANRSTIPYSTLRAWRGSITTRDHQSYSDEVKSKVLSEIQEELARGGSIQSYANRSTIPYSTLRTWRGSIATRVHRTYSNEEKASILSGLRQELQNNTSTLKSYADKKGIPVRTLSYWLKDEGTSRGT